MGKEISIHHRPQWKTHIGFLLATIGSAIGLGNIWRFPYLCYKNGGGAFLIPYFIALFVVGIPIMILEIGLGHKMKGSAPASFAAVSRKWEWLGWWQVIFVMFGIVLYYCVVIAWCLNFLFFSFNLAWQGNPNEFFFQKFLMVSASPFRLGDLRTPIIFSLLIVWFLNWFIVFKGVVKGLERANKIFMPLLFVLTAILVFWSLNLEGAKKGILVYLSPDFSQLKRPSVWIDAFSQIFFTLSIGFGIIITYASYLPHKTQIVKDAFTVSLANCFFSLFAGLGVFSVLGYMAYVNSLPISEVVRHSIGLAFVAYPKAISTLPCFRNLFGIIFFGILVIAGLSSAISILEAFTSAVIDKFHYSRKVVVSVLSVLGFLGGIIFTTQAGLYLLDIVDHFLTNYGLIVGGIFECFLLGWIYKIRRLREHISHSSHTHLSRIWDFSIKIISPLVLVVLLISSLNKELSSAYGNYPVVALILIGMNWLIYTLFFAIIVASQNWRVEPDKA
ncbi:MAG: sodium-dependent transporter [Candidatus Omnitrophica bacterium 4484_70.1]|nr:MAG: sodium-dependent transporter [Candidatus Omnitrophica bacterium 4484_70.1]